MITVGAVCDVCLKTDLQVGVSHARLVGGMQCWWDSVGF